MEQIILHKITELDSMKAKKDLSDVVNYMDNMFKSAIEVGASDIHIEPNEDFIMIRFRQD